MNIDVELSEPQSTVFLCKKRFRLVVAGRRFGKSFLAWFEMLYRAISPEATKKGGLNIFYVANTSDNARRICWQKFLNNERYTPRKYIEKMHDQRMFIKFKNGSTIQVLSGDSPNSLVGSSIDFLVMDECAYLSADVFAKLYPALTDKYCNGEALLISSPEGYNWFYGLYSKYLDGTNPLWQVFHYTTAEGGNVRPEEIEEAKKTLSLNDFKKFYLASFDTMSDKVYENYDSDANDAEYDDTWGQGDIHVGMDFNVRPMTAAISVVEEDRELGETITFFDEIVTEGFSNTQQMCDKIKARYPKSTVYVYPDPTGNKHQPSAPIGVTDMSILRDNGFIVCAPHAPYASKDKWNTVNTAMCTADGQRRVKICKKRCPHLVDSLNGFVFKENGEPDKNQGFDHITDAMAYEICYKLPIRKGRLYRPRMYGA